MILLRAWFPLMCFFLRCSVFHLVSFILLLCFYLFNLRSFVNKKDDCFPRDKYVRLQDQIVFVAFPCFLLHLKHEILWCYEFKRKQTSLIPSSFQMFSRYLTACHLTSRTDIFFSLTEKTVECWSLILSAGLLFVKSKSLGIGFLLCTTILNKVTIQLFSLFLSYLWNL